MSPGDPSATNPTSGHRQEAPERRATPTADFTIGVEEEFGLVDPVTRELRPEIAAVLPEARTRIGSDEVSTELQQSQIEIGTPVCNDLTEVRRELARLRSRVATAATTHGLAPVAAGSYPMASAQARRITDKAAYRELDERYAHLAQEQLVFGCHVHVAVADREEAVVAMGHLRPWLAPLLALSSSSPYWDGGDTGYASYRTTVFTRWPTAGPPELFRSRAEFDDVVSQLVATDTIDAPARIYWDVRPSARFDTLELRVADVCPTLDDAVAIAGVAGALVRTGVRLVREGRPPPAVRPELLRSTRWRAARYGLDGELVDLRRLRSAPAAVVVEDLMTFVAPTLEDWGEGAVVRELVDGIVERGTAAARQRGIYARRRSLEDVVDWLLAEITR